MTAKVLNLRLSLRRNQAYVLAALSIALVIGLSIGFHTQIKDQLNSWKLLPQPERLTELYFTSPNNLPSTYTPGQQQNVQFTAHNLEYRTTTYTYKIVEISQDGTQSQQLASGQFTLRQNQYEKPSVSITPANLGTQTKIVIDLQAVNESIDYWVNRSNQ